MFVVVDRASVFLFHAPFSEEADEYAAAYNVYMLPADVRVPEHGSWEHLPANGTLLSTIPVSSVVFDTTGRAAVDAAVLKQVEMNSG
jgi:hypothetical protein